MSRKTGTEYEAMCFYENVAMNNWFSSKEGWIDIGSKNYFKEGVAVGFFEGKCPGTLPKNRGLQ